MTRNSIRQLWLKHRLKRAEQKKDEELIRKLGIAILERIAYYFIIAALTYKIVWG
jgi:hypothetical protein